MEGGCIILFCFSVIVVLFSFEKRLSKNGSCAGRVTKEAWLWIIEVSGRVCSKY